MIRTVLVDDETDSIRILQRLLENYCPQVSIVGTAGGVETALPLIRETKPDLVLLDIEMAQGNAFDLLNQLQPIDFKVIFVTAFDNYAVRAFKYSAVDYLLKPVDIDDLRSAINRVEKKADEHAIVQQMKMLLDNVGALNLPQQKMAIPTITGLIFITVQDIIRFEAKGNYTSIYLYHGRTHPGDPNDQGLRRYFARNHLLPDPQFPYHQPVPDTEIPERPGWLCRDGG